MKENKYDNKEFYEKYSKMYRSLHGLEGAGEWHQLKKMLPPIQNKSVLDLGCGYGWHTKYASEQGAKEVIGVDISKNMLDIARKKNNAENITYIQNSIEDLDFLDKKFDIVISSLALHYIKDFDKVVSNVYKWLNNKGSFIFSTEHPIFTAQGSEDWYYNENGQIKHFPIDNYFYEGKRNTNFLGEKVIKYHRTITTFVQTLLQNNFIIKSVVEPTPDPKLMNLDGMKDELRRPIMIIFSCEKN